MVSVKLHLDRQFQIGFHSLPILSLHLSAHFPLDTKVHMVMIWDPHLQFIEG